MFARFQITGSLSRADADRTEQVARIIAAHQGYLGLVAAGRIPSGGLMLTLWATESDARAASERTAAVLGPRSVELLHDEVYAVTDVHTGVAAGEPATVVQCLLFDGPRGDAQIAAWERVVREHITPAVVGTPGTVAAFVARAEDGAVVSVTLGTALDVFDDMQRRVLSVLPTVDEEPALLADADRVELGRTARVDLPALLPAAVPA